MKIIGKILGLTGLFLFVISCNTSQDGEMKISSPTGKNQIQFELIDGAPYYSVSHGDKQIVSPSLLGFVFQDNDSLVNNLTVVDVKKTSFDETWEQVWGEKKKIRNHYNQLSLQLKENTDQPRQFEIQFRAFDDGVAFRYIFPEQSNMQDSILIMDELTEFNLTENGDSWWIPAYVPNRYEHLFTKTKVNEIDTVHTPYTIKRDDGIHLSLHEANLKNYASYTVAMDEGTNLDLDLMPWSDGVKVKREKDFVTPWRTLQIGESAGDLVESYLILNLNDPNKLTDLSYINHYKYTGIWWGMHTSKYTFYEGPKHGASTENAFEYIDNTKKLGVNYMLIEGWNKGWTPEWYLNAMHMFSFTDATDDFDYQKVADYAKKNDIQLIGYHETGSNIINYKKQIDDGFQLYKDLGIHDIKIGQVGDKLNMKEWHGSQFGVEYYRWVLEKAAEYQLAVNFHEPIKDTGERRTYPNMMAREGARGQEYNAWSEGNPPSHTVILPFTRMLSGPMDFTPGVIDIMQETGFNGRRVHTTAAKQLAMYVAIYSPIQMLADLPENYLDKPEYQFLADVPTDWDDTKVINAEIGEYYTVARKDIDSDDWFIGSMTNEVERDFELDLSFLPSGTYEAQIYADAPGTDIQNNPTRVAITTQEVSAGDKLSIHLGAGGGAAIRLKKL